MVLLVCVQYSSPHPLAQRQAGLRGLLQPVLVAVGTQLGSLSAFAFYRGPRAEAVLPSQPLGTGLGSVLPPPNSRCDPLTPQGDGAGAARGARAQRLTNLRRVSWLARAPSRANKSRQV